VSVFIAIALESAWQDLRDRHDATEVGQLLEELKHDRSEVEVVIPEQQELAQLYTRLFDWLSDPGLREMNLDAARRLVLNAKNDRAGW